MLWARAGRSREGTTQHCLENLALLSGDARLSLSGCQHLKGKEEEGERGDRDIVEQEGASGCHQPVV